MQVLLTHQMSVNVYNILFEFYFDTSYKVVYMALEGKKRHKQI